MSDALAGNRRYGTIHCGFARFHETISSSFQLNMVTKGVDRERYSDI
ncbi:MAG: hypothetical protein ABJM58_10320 [Alteripontixanthobacter sp.]